MKWESMCKYLTGVTPLGGQGAGTKSVELQTHWLRKSYLVGQIGR